VHDISIRTAWMVGTSVMSTPGGGPCSSRAAR
jgi:hypothetical protein